MNTIAVDLRFLETPTGRRGVGFFNRNIFKQLFKIPHSGLQFRLFEFPQSNLHKEFEIEPQDKFLQVPALYWPKKGLRRLDPFFSIFWKRILKKLKPDILHLPFVFDVYHLSIPINIKTVITIYDVIPLIFPKEYFQNKKAEDWYRKRFEEVKKASKIITISNSSKKDIVKMLNIDPEKVKVIYGAVDDGFKRIEGGEVLKTLQKYGITKPYILTVSTHSFHKNTPRIFVAFKEYINSQKNGNLNLVVVCKLIPQEEKDWREQIKKLGIENKVTLTNFVSQGDLPAIYSGSEAFIFPSLYEGLGLPVLEAMACGTPVITSGVSSLPEAGGESAFYVNPQSAEDIKKALVKVLGDRKLRSEMIKKGFAQVKKFSWARAAGETLKVYQDLLTV